MKRTVALLTCVALMIPGAAVASANSTQSGYGHPAVKNVTASRSNKTNCTTGSGSSSSSSGSQCVSATTTTAAGSLPFTGLDLGALSVGAVVLLGAGIMLRRASATSRT